jgi:hypothetical protein
VNRIRVGPLIFAGLIFNAPLWARWRHKTNDVTAVRMEFPKHNMVAMSCQINGAGHRYLCVIDSGATYTVISDRVVEAEGPSADLTTLTGVKHVHEREVSLTIAGGLKLKSKAYVESDMIPQDVDILLGQDVLRQFRSVVFDYEKQQVEFHR